MTRASLKPLEWRFMESSAKHFTSEHPHFLGHPVGLYILFATEMWERFSYYGMRALLVLYMTGALLADPVMADNVFGLSALRGILEGMYGPLETQPLSSHIYGLYTAFVYLTPLFGGILADRFLGQRRSVVLGGVLMAVGHFLMAFESLFLVALLFLILGNGAFKPNISTQVGALYPPGDPRRDGAFTIFYMGINLGAMLSPLVCGTLGQLYGWHYGFGAAGVGMVLGLLLYVIAGAKYLPPDIRAEKKTATTEKVKLTQADWQVIGALVVLCGLNIVFWGVYEQQGNTMQLWADDRTNWGFVPSTWFQSMNPAIIVVFAPLLDMFWRWQGRRGRDMSSVTKMGVGCLMLGFSFLIMVAAAQVVPEDQRGSVLWLFFTVFVLTMGELYLSPIGLSLVTKVSPPHIMSMMMGMWFLSSFFGNYMSGYLGSFYSTMDKEQFFLMLSGLGIVAGVVMLILNIPLRRVLDARIAEYAAKNSAA
jgi:POT family proton-dependent oligopeptide transporter